jgi:adenine phosphoribosyltransferase
MQVLDHVRDVPDFPRPGVTFRDITPLLASPEALRETIERLAFPFRTEGVTKVAGIEARGFVFGAPVAVALGAGFVPLRKPGKLPWKKECQEYALEYGTDSLEIHADGAERTDRVPLVDDVLATGGTASAALALIRRLGGVVVGAAFVLELEALGGRRRLRDVRVEALARVA